MGRKWWSSFQAEGGIRDVAGTGVQTCALPIPVLERAPQQDRDDGLPGVAARWRGARTLEWRARDARGPGRDRVAGRARRSEERRVGKEGRSRWAPYH